MGVTGTGTTVILPSVYKHWERSGMVMKLNHAKLRELRIARGMTMREAGEKAKLGKNPAQRWNSLELGIKPNVKLSTLSGVADALGVDGKELITS
jgi:transcriptional regulator with XRE-family HTH domain